MNTERPIVTSKSPRDLHSQIGLGAAVTNSDTEDLPDGVTRSIYVCAEGSLKVTLFDMADDTFVNYSTIHPGRHPMFVKRIWLGSTASIVAEY